MGYLGEGMTASPLNIWHYSYHDVLEQWYDEVISSRHTVPMEQFVHILDARGSCLCGPAVIVGEDSAVVQHYGLAPQYHPDHQGWDDDDGLDEDHDHEHI